MTRHFSILTAVCAMLMDFLAYKTGQDPPLSITLLELFPNYNSEDSWRDFIKELFIRNLLTGDHVGQCGSLTPPPLGTGPRDKASPVLLGRVCTNKKQEAVFQPTGLACFAWSFLTQSQVC